MNPLFLKTLQKFILKSGSRTLIFNIVPCILKLQSISFPELISSWKTFCENKFHANKFSSSQLNWRRLSPIRCRELFLFQNTTVRNWNGVTSELIESSLIMGPLQITCLDVTDLAVNAIDASTWSPQIRYQSLPQNSYS